MGSGILQDGICGIAVWGDDPTTDQIDGAVEGQPLTFKYLTGRNFFEAEYSLLSGEAVYDTDGLIVIDLVSGEIIPEEFGLTSAYPNPFNSKMKVSFGLPEVSDITLTVYDYSGRHVKTLASGRHEAGIHTIVFDGSDLVSSVYLLRFEAGGNISQMKAVLVK